MNISKKDFLNKQNAVADWFRSSFLTTIEYCMYRVEPIVGSTYFIKNAFDHKGWGHIIYKAKVLFNNGTVNK